MYDLLIVGGGPAGASAAVYAARKQLRTLMIVDEWGGQSTVSPDIHNWIGTPSISGADLAIALKTHVEKSAGEFLEVRSGKRAASLAASDDMVTLTLNDGTVVEGKTILITTGSQRRKLEVPGAETYDNKGLTYCATCDGPLYGGTDVAVVGGGNAAFETALQLLAYCKTVTLLNRTETFRADEITVGATAAHTNMRIVKNAVPIEIVGEKFVTGIKYIDANSKAETLLPVAGIFVEIGLLPNTSWLGNTVTLNKIGQVEVDPRSQKSTHVRIWAAGDCTNGLYHQNNIAAGDAVKALEDIYLFVKKV